MIKIDIFCRMGLVLAAFSFSAAAYAQQQNQPSTQQPSGLSDTDIQAIIDHERQGMMNQCANLRQQMRQGVAIKPEMQQVMTRCDQMDQQKKR